MKSRASSKDSDAGGSTAPRKRRQVALRTGQLHDQGDGMQGAQAGEELAITMAEFMVRPMFVDLR